MIMGKHTGERILNSISVRQRIKKWFQRPTYIRRLNDYASTRCTSLKWHRNKNVVVETNLLLCLLRTSRELQLNAKTTPALGESDYSASSHGRITSGESPRYLPKGWIGPTADLRVKTPVLAGNRIPVLLCWESLHYKH